MALPKTVLIVDDSKVSRLMCIGLMRKQLPGVRFIEAGNTDEARAQVTAEQPEWMVLDHNMPGQTGLDLASELRPLHPALRIALVTANIQEATQARAAALGIEFFRKPVNEAMLTQLIHRLSADEPNAQLSGAAS